MTTILTGHSCHNINDQMSALYKEQFPFVYALCRYCQSPDSMQPQGRCRLTSLLVVCSAISAFSKSTFCSSSLSLLLAVRWTACSALVSLPMHCRLSLKAAIDANCRKKNCQCHVLRVLMLSDSLSTQDRCMSIHAENNSIFGQHVSRHCVKGAS